MTLQEAWKIYQKEVQQKTESYQNAILKSRQKWTIVGIVAAIIGFILLIIGYSLPLETDILGNEERSIGAFLLILYGWMILAVVSISFLIAIPASNKKIEEGPPNFLLEGKNYYLNCLRADDIDADQKIYCEQKLKDIRHQELLSEIRNVADAANTATAVASAAMLHNVINKK